MPSVNNTESLVKVPLPKDWAAVDTSEYQGKTHEIIEAIYVGPEAVEEFVANMVVLSTPSIPQNIEEWLQESIQSLVDEIPGFFVVDQQPWASDYYSGALVCGTYIMERTAVTLLRWLLIGETSTFTLDATCATSELSTMTEVFFDVANSCQER